MRAVEEEEGVEVVGAEEPHLLVGEEEQSCLHEVSQLNPDPAIAAEYEKSMFSSVHFVWIMVAEKHSPSQLFAFQCFTQKSATLKSWKGLGTRLEKYMLA